jgi:hypothetical protein
MRRPLFALLFLAFVLTACKGASGDDGRRGPRGPAGDQGAQGVQGEPGLDGAPGASGVTSKLDLYLVSDQSDLPPGDTAEAIAVCDDDNDIMLQGGCSASNTETLALKVFGPGGTPNTEEGYLADFRCVYQNDPLGYQQLIFATGICISVAGP